MVEITVSGCGEVSTDIVMLPGRFLEAEVAVPRQMFQEILILIAQLRAPPAPA